MAQEEHSAVPVEIKQAAHPPRVRHSELLRDKHVRQLFHNEIDRMFERMWGGWMAPFHRIFEHEPALRSDGPLLFAEPAVDLTEDKTAFTITAEVPGLEQKDIEVALSGDVLTVKGEKRTEKEEKEKDVYISERGYGSFQRSFALPEGIDRGKITADLSKGVLKVSLPKTSEAQQSQKKIEVKAAA